MFEKKMLIISTSIAVSLTIVGQANADVTIIHGADGGTEVQAGRVKISTGDGGTQLQTGGSLRLPEQAELTARGNSRKYRNRRYTKPAVGNIQVKIPDVRIKPIYVPNVSGPTVIRSTGGQGGVYSSQTNRSSNGSSSNSQTTVIRGDGHSNTNSNHDSD
jgi:hypothetical protein